MLRPAACPLLPLDRVGLPILPLCCCWRLHAPTHPHLLVASSSVTLPEEASSFRMLHANTFKRRTPPTVTFCSRNWKEASAWWHAQHEGRRLALLPTPSLLPCCPPTQAIFRHRVRGAHGVSTGSSTHVPPRFESRVGLGGEGEVDARRKGGGHAARQRRHHTAWPCIAGGAAAGMRWALSACRAAAAAQACAHPLPQHPRHATRAPPACKLPSGNRRRGGHAREGPPPSGVKPGAGEAHLACTCSG